MEKYYFAAGERSIVDQTIRNEAAPLVDIARPSSYPGLRCYYGERAAYCLGRRRLLPIYENSHRRTVARANDEVPFSIR